MANLRLIAVKVLDSVTIRARFTESLDPTIATENVTVVSNSPGIPDSKVLKLSIRGPIMTITVRPLSPYAAYFITFASTDTFDFKSIGGSFIFEDGKTNVSLILGAEDPADPVRDSLLQYLDGSPYGLENGSIVRDVINLQASTVSRALYDIRALKNDNYLTVNVTDELKIRGDGPFDRLNEEGAYEILRVGKNRTNTALSTKLSFDSFPSSIITLEGITVTNEKLVAGTGDGTFNNLILTTKNKFVSKLNSVTIQYQIGGSVEYDISSYGYQILESRYDQDFASPLFILEDNQFKLSDTVLESSFVPPKAGDFIFINYEYRDTGRFIDEESVTVSQVLSATREVAPALKTQFFLKHAPVVSAADVIPTSGGIEFLDPSSDVPFYNTHPAFVKELPFKLDGLPTQPGEFSVDYETGTVYCYGIEIGDGTGDYPPVMNYLYRKTFSKRLDYTYDPETQEVVANPLRDLIGQEAKISFDYEKDLVSGVDYVPQIHAEILDERIENRLVAINALKTSYAPITNVFRIFNETTGEVYRITRWNGNKVYFSSSTPPRIFDQNRERVKFTDVLNETLIVTEEGINALGTRYYTAALQNNKIIAASEDTIGSSLNSSVTFSRNDLFERELYYDDQTSTKTENIDRITIGSYQIDYQNGILYCGVATDQNFDIGTINYKKSSIAPQNSHVISVSEIYNSISTLIGVNKRIQYTGFEEATVQPATFDRSDERFLNGDSTAPYIVSSGTITVQDDIKEVRGVYDHYDLMNNATPTNFGEGVEVSGNVITLSDGVVKEETLVIESGGIVNVSSITPGAEITEVLSVIKLNDGTDLWLTPGTFSDYEVTLSGSPTVGDIVTIRYVLSLNGSATPIVDYNRGDYFIDYSFLADEILVSYEHGDNCIDFRESDAIGAGETYYVSYKVGALRDALLKNFGTLVNLPILNSFDTAMSRERYRDALKAALQSFTKGPTIPAISNIVSNITHIDPIIEEAAFQNWSLGTSRLYPISIGTTGSIQLLSAKYDYGALISESDQTITFPVSSNLRLEEGTLEMWVIPEWNGLDNDATLTFSIEKDGYALSANSIFIGADSYNPVYDNNTFTINKSDVLSPVGLPSKIYTDVGVFIYYDDIQNQWKVYARDIADAATDKVYSGTIRSSGEFYNVKFISGLGELDDILRSGTDKITFEFHINANDASSPDGYNDGYNLTDGYSPGDGYTVGYSFDGIVFMADDPHYLFDFGKSSTNDRFSLLKDGSGYLNFNVRDSGKIINGKRKAGNKYEVSADISSWLAGEKHHVAVGWRLNSPDRRDELHLFIDGVEVPNIMKFGGRPEGTTSDRFRTVKPEILTNAALRPAIVGNDLVITVGSNVVTSSVDFQAQGILPGDTLTILEDSFGQYNVTAVNGNELTLDSVMPASIADGRFSANEFSSVVSSEIDLFGNIAVSIIRDSEEIEIPGLRADIPGYSVDKNALNQNVLTVLGNVEIGDKIAIRTLGVNHRRCRDTQFIWGDTSSIIRTQLPPPINLNEVKVTSVLLPLVAIGPSNATYTFGAFNATLSATQPSNSTEGRTLSVRITGGNVNFGTPVSVTINGTTQAGPIFETILFSSASTVISTNKFKSITSVNVTATPLISSKNSISIEIKEAYSVTVSEGNDIYPVIRFSYKTQAGSSLEGSGDDIVLDNNGYFVQSNVGQKIVIESPGSVSGTYSIVEWIDSQTIRIDPAPASSFTAGKYSLFNTTIGNSGYQNGWFTFETAGAANVAYPLPQGFYEFDFSSYLEIPFRPIDELAYIGSDFNGTKQAKAIIDEFRVLSRLLTDVRVGESIADGTESITTDFTALRPFEANSDTLMLLHFDSAPFKNEADYWITSEKMFLQSGDSVNGNFDKSLVIINQPIKVDNAGLFSTSSEGSIEFWVSPRFDTYNDPEERFYFDATGSVLEEVTSLTNGTVVVSGSVERVLSVRLASDVTGAGPEYFGGGSLSSDFKTINLQKALPSQRTPVIVNYIPSGLSGNRISIYKDRSGYITFSVNSNEQNYQVRQPIFWARDTWHRITASFKFNRADNLDELRMFIDGEEKGVVTFGSGLIFGTGIVFGETFNSLSDSKLTADINFSDPINEFFIGSDYLKTHPANARIDNLRLSNIARKPVIVSGQARDINFNSNLSVIYPVVEDAFTTYLLNFDTLISKATDFALLRDEKFGIFDFTVNIIDSFGIVAGNAKIKQTLENLLLALKPANSKITMKYE